MKTPGRSFVPAKYLLLTGVSAGLLLGSTFALHDWLGLPQEAAYAVALVIVFLFNFVCLRYLVFSSRAMGFFRQLVGFGAGSGVFRLGEYFAFLVLHSLWGVHYLIAVILISATFLVAKFFFHSRILFPKSMTDSPQPPNQEVEGLLSPWLRDLRLKQVARQVPQNALVLDLACGAGFLRRFLPPSCRYFGVDRLETPTREPFTDFRQLDLCRDDIVLLLEDWLPGPVNCLTMVAFLEHLEDPSAFVAKLRPLLQPGALIIGSTPHPTGRRIHDALARLGVCSRSGAEEHEAFLSRADLENVAAASGFRLVVYRRFLFGLNQLFVMESVARE